MSSRRGVTPSLVDPVATPSEPQFGGGTLGGQPIELRDPVAETDAAKADRLINAFYEAERKAISIWGTPESLARLQQMDFGDLSRRLNRKHHKGVTWHAFLDFAAIACTNDAAFGAFLALLSDAGGYEPPRKKRVKKTPEETIAALKKQLKLFGPVGEQALQRAGVEEEP